MNKIDKNFSQIEKKHYNIISHAKSLMMKIEDPEHSYGHVLDVLDFCKKIVALDDYNADLECLVISIYWHDVGRLNVNEGHEAISAKLLKTELLKQGYPIEFANKCHDAIIYHKWSMKPKTIEGIILRDADKLAFLGENRWKNCLKNRYKLDGIVNLLPKLKNEILFLNESKQIFDDAIVSFSIYLYNQIFKYNK